MKVLEGSTSSNHDLGLNDINSGNFFCDCVLNLDSWINFYKIEGAAIFLNQKFYGTGIDITNMFTESHSAF